MYPQYHGNNLSSMYQAELRQTAAQERLARQMTKRAPNNLDNRRRLASPTRAALALALSVRPLFHTVHLRPFRAK